MPTMIVVNGGALKTFLRFAVAMLAALTLAALLPTSVLAHTLYNGWDKTWEDSGYCDEMKVTTEHPYPYWGGTWLTEFRHKRPFNAFFGSVPCDADDPLAAGQLATKVVILVDTNWDGSWAICLDTGWQYSDSERNTWQTKVYAPAYDPTWSWYAYSPCGIGSYKMRGYGAHRNGPTWIYSQLNTKAGESLELPDPMNAGYAGSHP
jgi:hypothetical protein